MSTDITKRFGIISGGTGSFGSIQFTDGDADGSARVEIFDHSKNLKNIASVSASGDIQGDGGTFGGNVSVAGNLTVNGTTTSVNSTAIELGDKIITLNTANAAGDAGIYVNDTDTNQTGSLLWDSDQNAWMGGLKDAEVHFVDLSSAQTLTNKTLTSPVISSGDINSPDIDGGTIDGATIATSDVTVGAGKTLDVSAGTLTLANDQISGDKVEGGTIASITISQLGGAMDANSQAMTNVNIDSGNIDGATIATSNITVGGGKTLDVSAGTLTLANDQISGDKVEGGTIAATTITTLSSTTVNATNVSASGYVSASSFEVDGQASIKYQSSALDFSSGGAGAKLSTTMFSSSVELQGPSMEVSGAAKVGSLTLGGTAVTATAAEINDLAGNAVDSSDFTKLSEVTATSAELNYLDNDDLTAADITKLAALNATAAEINIVDGDTAASSVTVADADRLVLNDGGTMKQVAMTDFEVYFESALDTLANVTTVGALNAGSITSGFGSIDNGSSTLSAGASTLASAKVSDLTSGRIVVAGTAGELEDNAKLLYNGTDLSLNGGSLQMSSSAQYTATGGDKYVSVAKVYAEGKGAYLSGVAYNQTQERFAFRGDDDSFQSIQADSYYAGADYQFAGGNTTFSDGNLNFGSAGSATVSGDDLSVGGSEGNNFKLLMGYKAGESTGHIKVVDADGSEHIRISRQQISGAVAFSGSSLVLDSSVEVSSIKDEDNMASNSATALATQQSIKAYVDAQLTAQDLDFQADSGGALSIDLDSETLSVVGTSNEITTAGSGNQIQIGLPDDVTIGDDLTLGSDGAILNFGADSEVSLTHVHDVGLRLTSSMKLQFRDATEFVHSDADGFMHMEGGTGVNLAVGGSDVLSVAASSVTSKQDHTMDGSIVFGMGSDHKINNKSGNDNLLLDSMSADVTAGGNLVVTTDLRINGNDIKDSGGSSAITFDGSTNTQANGNFTVANTKDILAGGADCEIGASDQKFAAGYFTNVYTGDMHLKNERGDWTIFEESDHLRIRNNLTGLTYKMGMTLIDE